jgi:hypothetical protein
MNVVEPLRELLAPDAGPGLRAPPLGRGRWNVLFGRAERPLLVPVGDYHFQERCVSYFVPGGSRGMYARALLWGNSVMPGRGLLPEFRLDDAGRSFLSSHRQPGLPSYATVQIGAPGPIQRASVVLVSEQGEALTYAKIAMAAGADRQIGLEAGWLRELEVARELEGQVPRLLAEGRASTSRRYLVTTLAPATRSTRAFTSAHVAFLAALGRVRRDVMSSSASPCFEFLESIFSGHGPRLPPVDRAALKAAARDCRVLLGDWVGPFVIGHGDFVPWNIRVQADRLFVFDWECTRAGANPLADAFNFHVMERALSSRKPDADFLAATLRRMEGVAHLLYPEWKWRPRAISGLALAYLLEVFLRYMPASRNSARAHPVTAAYLRLIEERSAWIET